jgi:hypothetical protein
MKKMMALAFGVGLSAVLLAAPGYATTGDGPSYATCANLEGWYANPDEQDQKPAPKEAGLEFSDKNLIHHATEPLDFTDVDKTNRSFTATVAGKVVFKMETSGPYSTIVTNADGKVWSTAFKPEAVGGQNTPVDKLEDLIGKPDAMKPGKVPYSAASRVTTFGVGYWVQEGSTIVSEVKFHGHTYPLTCKPKPSPSSSSSATSTPTTTPATTPATTKPTASSTSPSPTGAVGGGIGPQTGAGGPSLPVTGPSMGWLIAGGSVLLAGGAAAVLLARRRRVTFGA